MARKTIPAWVDLSGINNKGVIAGAQTGVLTDGKVVGVCTKRAGVNPDSVIGRSGISATNEASDPAKLWKLWDALDLFGGLGVPRRNDGGFDGLNLTEANVRQAARSIPLVAYAFDQFGEGHYSIPNTGPLYAAFYDELRQRYVQAGIPIRFGGSYGAFTTDCRLTAKMAYHKWDYLGNTAPTDNTFRQFYGSPQNARNFNDYLINGSLHNAVGTCIKYYPTQFDYGITYYILKAKMEIVRAGMLGGNGLTPIQDGYCPLFIFGMVESLNNGALHNGMFYERRIASPAGLVKMEEHPVYDFDHILGVCFAIGFFSGSGVIGWDDKRPFSTDPNRIPQLNQTQTPAHPHRCEWIPDQAGAVPTEGDYNEATLGMPHAPMTWHDAVLVAAEWYHECRRTHSASPRYVRYKVNGGAWIEPQQDKSDILFHAAANNGPYATAAGSRHGRGDCMVRRVGNAIDWYYFDPSLPRYRSETITVDVDGNEFTQVVRGGELCVCNETV